MMKLVEQAMEALRDLPEDRQAKVARAILTYAEHKDEIYRLSDNERAAVRVGLEQAKRGEFVSDAELEGYRHRHDA